MTESSWLLPAHFDASKLDLGTMIFAHVWLTRQDNATVEQFTSAVRRLPNVLEFFLMAGDCDFILRVVARDLDDYRQFQIDHLTRIPCIANVKSEIPMQKIKLTRELPV